MAAKIESIEGQPADAATGSDDKLNQQSRTIVEDFALQRQGEHHQQQPVHKCSAWLLRPNDHASGRVPPL